MKNIILLLFTFLSFSTFSQDKDAEYYANFMRDSLYDGKIEDQRDYRLMIDYLNEAIRLDSTNVRYFTNRGYANIQLKNWDAALKDYRYALMIDSTSVKYAANAHYFRGKAFGSRGNFDEALKSINKAISIDSNDVEFYNNKAYILRNKGDFDEAIINFKIAQKFRPDLKLRFEDVIKKTNALKYTDFRKVGSYYPYVWLSAKDSIKYPIKVGIEFNLNSLKIDQLEDNTFSADFSTVMYSKYPPEFISSSIEIFNYSTDTVYLANVSNKVRLKTLDSLIKPRAIGRSLEFSQQRLFKYLIEGKYNFDHIWDLSDFPFDAQKFRITLETVLDTSVYRFEKNQTMGIKNHFRNVEGLPVGMTVKEVNFFEEYVTSDVFSSFSPKVKRFEVYPRAVFEIVVSRSGSLLFIKLFLGTFLAFIMSLSAFTISKRNFPSRIDVSVGALFIAVGNKYFVESTTPMVQILTKADIINNLSLLLIIMNVVFIISQHRKDINIGKFEDSKYTLKFSAALLAALVFITIIF